MSFCTKCGTKLPENVRFCMNCGAVVSGNTARANTNAGPAVQVVLPPKPAKSTKWKIALWIIIPLLVVGVAAAAVLSPNDEEKIEDCLNTFAKAYSQGDASALKNCMDAKSRNGNKAGSSVANSALSKKLGVSVDVDGVWSLGVALFDYEMEIDVLDIGVDGDEATVEATMTIKYDDWLMGEQSQSFDAVFEMVKEGNDWYIHDMKER